MQIIERDYGDPTLSLVGVSNNIHVSPNYLSALIKKETGASFVDLLTKKTDRDGERAGTGQRNENEGDRGTLRLQRSALF